MAPIDPYLQYFLLPASVSIIAATVLMVVKHVGEYRKTRRQQIVLVNGLSGEIDAIRTENKKQSAIFHAGLSSGLIRKRISENNRYFPYSAISESVHIVFDTKRNDFSFLGPKVFVALVEAYDENALYVAVMKDCRTSEFRELDPDRKYAVLEGIGEQLTTVEKQFSQADSLISQEKKRLAPSWREKHLLWITDQE